ncbi:Trp biosynthesis-associated membrane protein [Pseudoclavibacter terrae]|uniref:Trp biosynthesis-associated membrane protein n=2 Tax=Pseudoclavibacter terrae TaxID=1530195 RepID=A0A7J5B358_9MICO|nr:Trp biosynthesis-associated membrane protein [Pseudoclavibacter terrae]
MPTRSSSASTSTVPPATPARGRASTATSWPWTSKLMSTPDAAGKRNKRTALMTIVVGAGLAILAWSQVWFSFDLALGPESYSGEVRGDVAAPAVMALALAALAVLAALALAGVVFRYVLGGLLTLVGAVLVLQSFVAVGNPAPAIAPEVTAASGLAGEQTIADAVAAGTVTVTFWPWLAVVAGAILMLAGLFAITTARRWPTGGRRFTTTSLEPVDAAAGDDEPDAAPPAAPTDSDRRVEQWDALSHGDDPTDTGGTRASS